ncbi:MAG: hypothetical protein ILNGONEN_02467 [Syntrophorhabdaceae bacterium]|jgi:hypothetical protein|nr:hypothetical protein [Syntrophorhabdaceae bacterium]MDI9560197.1 hypothetical protein [Pseudomonadota bacterium]HOG40003.1 hypothetical protein [Syntrophorhabdaceae bacterium]HOR57571.1 hypothetical protein [bacterium]
MNISNVTSRYDFNLVEFPIFVFAKKGEGKHIKEIVYRDTISGKNGETVERVWTVLPDSKYGFGSETTLSTLYDLFQIWSAADFEDKKIKFGTINNLLKMRGIAYADKQDYQRVLRDLYCLQGINIDTKNAFWDNDKKAYVDIRLHLFVSLYLYRAVGRRKYGSPFSYIEASDEFYGSVQKNAFILDFGSEFFHSLTPIEQRLALYLSKIFRSQTLHRKSIIELAQQIPLYQKETRNIKQELKIALDGLIAKKFEALLNYNFEKNRRGDTEYIVFRGKPRILHEPAVNKKTAAEKDAFLDLLVADIIDICGDENSRGYYIKVVRNMDEQTIRRALSEVKEIRDTGTIIKSKGALFTSIIKKYAAEQGKLF